MNLRKTYRKYLMSDVGEESTMTHMDALEEEWYDIDESNEMEMLRQSEQDGLASHENKHPDSLEFSRQESNAS